MRFNRFKYIYFLFFFLSQASINAHAQETRVILDSLAHRLESLSNGTQTTSIYLRTSKDIYESMEDLWFKAYSVDLQSQLLSTSDSVLYVQLIRDSDDGIVWEELYPIEKGIASGHIYLNDSLPNGRYWLCAYSSHSFNRKDNHFIDARKIELVGNAEDLIGKKETEPVGDSVKRNIQFNLFPEGGVLLSGVSNKVAFKAVNKEGLPQTVSGTLFEDDKAVTTINSVHDGMGSFMFRPQTGKNYAVRLDEPYEDSLYQLPEIRSQSLSLSLAGNHEDSLSFRIYNNGFESRSFYLRVQTRGQPAVMAAGEVKDSILLSLPLVDITPGISEVTLFDHQLRPLAERLVYVKPDARITISTRLSKTNVGRREKLSLHIRASNDKNKPAVSQLGVVAYDRLYHDPSDSKDIQTHYLLSNHLRGNIHNPGYYFDTTKTNRNDALDLLLLTQGWRSYLWSEPEMSRGQEETGSMLPTGIKAKLISKRKSTPQQTVLLFDAEQSHNRFITIDNNGGFSISAENMDIGTDIYIKHFGKLEDFDIQVSDPFEIIRNSKPWKDLKYPQLSEEFNNKKDEDAFNSKAIPDLIQLEEVVVMGKKETGFRDKYIGQLDSLAKYQNNTDRVHGGWLNCPTGDGDELPIEGKSYRVWTGPNPPTSHPFVFDGTNTKRIVYRYPEYTEEELLRKFGIARSKGYYPDKTFYQPMYDKVKDSLPDYRNTVLWVPNVVTDENGEAYLEFYSSDLETEFYGIVEGIDEYGLLGKTEFHFTVESEGQ